MRTFSIIVGTILVSICVFCIITLIAGTINHVDFYEQLSRWFGHGSDFEKLFKK